MRVAFVSLGCAKNLVDSQIMAGSLVSAGMSLANSPAEADVIVINTCAFINDARAESTKAILSACSLRKQGSCKAVIVAGCMPQRYKKDMFRMMPGIDAIIGLDELRELPNVIKKAIEGSKEAVYVSDVSKALFEPGRRPVIFSKGAFAYIKIAEGCNHPCAFCAIPSIRGKYRSRKPDDIVKEAEYLLDKGFRELNLISQDVTSYGLDLQDKANLSGLVRKIGNIGGKFWIRILYAYPGLITDDLLDAIGGTAQACHYFDVPVQHSDPVILKSMRRAGTTLHVANLTERIRSHIPDATIRTAIITGFPGETEEKFKGLIDYVKASEFDHLGVFTFSPEKGTVAEKLPGRPSASVAEKRKKAIMRLQKKIVDEKHLRLLSVTDEVLLERCIKEANNTWIARSQRLAPEVDGEIYVSGVPAGKRQGEFVKIRYTDAAGYDMIAETVI